MSALTNRIYHELADWKFTQLVLTDKLSVETSRYRFLEFSLIIVSLIGIAGWFRTPEYKILWTSLLIIVQAVRMAKGLFLFSQKDLFNMQSSIDFYNYHLRDLENLFYDFYTQKYSDSTIEKRLLSFQDDERQLFKDQSFGTIRLKSNVQLKMEKETDKYLNKIKSIINV